MRTPLAATSLSKQFTLEYVVVNAVRIHWGDPYGSRHELQYWTDEEAMDKPIAGVWNVSLPHSIGG
jgi:hypothetical protein